MALVEELFNRITVFREPWFAVNISTLFPGLGQIYSGKINRGIFIIFIQSVIIYLIYFFTFSKFSNIYILIILFVINIIYFIWNIYDTYKTAILSNDEVIEIERKYFKDAWFSVFLSRIVPGLGHLYLKNWIAGISYIIIFLLLLYLSDKSIIILAIIPFFYTFVSVHSYLATPHKREDSYKKIYLISLLIFIGCLEIVMLPLIVKNKYYDSYKVNNIGMFPELNINDYVLITKSHKLKRGDIIVIVNPNDEYNYLIKRLIAFGGEKVQIRNSVLYINGNYFVDDKISKLNFKGIEDFEYIVPENEYFIIGDNINNSLDSRYFGSIQTDKIIGPVKKIYWPPDRYKDFTN